MTRPSRPLLVGVLLALPLAAGCHVYEDRVEVFPRLRHALSGEGRNCSSTPADRRSADPASRAGIPYNSGPGYGSPTGLPTGYTYPLSGGTYPGGDPYPFGDGTPLPGGTYPGGTFPSNPRPTDVLPPPGGYAPPRDADQGRGVSPIAPKPSVLSTSDPKK